MSSLILSGAPVRDAVFAELERKVAGARRAPGLAVVLVGDDPASAVYVRSKGRACGKLGYVHRTIRLPGDAPEAEVLAVVRELNDDDAIDGVLVQIPLPPAIDAERVQLAIAPEKDVDGLHPENLGRLLSGRPRFVPCTPKGVLRLLEHYDIPVAGRRVAVVGRSTIVGRPMAMLLNQKAANATVTLCHTGTRDLAAEVARAEIVVAAMGAPEALTRAHVAEGAVVVDVGVNRVDDPGAEKGYRLTGDVHPEALEGWASAYTPVPGGVGLMTIAMLMANTWDAMEARER